MEFADAMTDLGVAPWTETNLSATSIEEEIKWT